MRRPNNYLRDRFVGMLRTTSEKNLCRKYVGRSENRAGEFTSAPLEKTAREEALRAETR
jgi:hypothetical protein